MVMILISSYNFVPFLAEENQRTHLDWVTIGQVKPQGSDDFIFTFSASENDMTLWDGKLPSHSVLRNGRLELDSILSSM